MYMYFDLTGLSLADTLASKALTILTSNKQRQSVSHFELPNPSSFVSVMGDSGLKPTFSTQNPPSMNRIEFGF